MSMTWEAMKASLGGLWKATKYSASNLKGLGASHGYWNLAKSIASQAWSSPLGKRAAIGAAAGAVYGGFSPNNSIVGGALAGATLATRGKAGLIGAGLGGVYGAISSNHTILGSAAAGGLLGSASRLGAGALRSFSTGYGAGGTKGWKAFSMGAKAAGNRLAINARNSVDGITRGVLNNNREIALNPIMSTMKV